MAGEFADDVGGLELLSDGFHRVLNFQGLLVRVPVGDGVESDPVGLLKQAEVTVVIVTSEGMIQGLHTQVLRRVWTVGHPHGIIPVGEALSEDLDVGLAGFG